MRRIDNMLQAARLRRATQHIAAGSSILDIGCHQGELEEHLRSRSGVTYAGIDPDLSTPRDRLVQGVFPDDLPEDWTMFDHAVALAVLEHVEQQQLPDFLGAVHSRLKPGGTLIATVPSPLTDRVLDVLKAMRLIDGMDLDAHDGLTMRQLTEGARAAGFELERHDRFQLGLNNLFVWSRPVTG